MSCLRQGFIIAGNLEFNRFRFTNTIHSEGKTKQTMISITAMTPVLVK
jgi:hypothetical protein